MEKSCKYICIKRWYIFKINKEFHSVNVTSSSIVESSLNAQLFLTMLIEWKFTSNFIIAMQKKSYLCEQQQLYACADWSLDELALVCANWPETSWRTLELYLLGNMSFVVACLCRKLQCAVEFCEFLSFVTSGTNVQHVEYFSSRITISTVCALKLKEYTFNKSIKRLRKTQETKTKWRVKVNYLVKSF